MRFNVFRFFRNIRLSTQLFALVAVSLLIAMGLIAYAMKQVQSTQRYCARAADGNAASYAQLPVAGGRHRAALPRPLLECAVITGPRWRGPDVRWSRGRPARAVVGAPAAESASNSDDVALRGELSRRPCTH